MAARPTATMLPEHRFYPAEGQDMNDTAIHTTGFRDLYLALGDDRGGGRFAFRAYVSPLAPLIWLGGLVMALGGALSLWGRLARAGAGRTTGRARRGPGRGMKSRHRASADAGAGCCAAFPHARAQRVPTTVSETFSDPAHGSARPQSAAAVALPGLPGREHRRVRFRSSPPMCAIWCASRSPKARATSRSRISWWRAMATSS